MDKEYFEDLVNKYFDGDITPDEFTLLNEAKNSNEEFTKIFKRYEMLMDQITLLPDESGSTEGLWEKVKAGISESDQKIQKISENLFKYTSPQATVVPDRKKGNMVKPIWIWSTVTITCIVLIVIALYSGFNSGNTLDNSTIGMLGHNWRITEFTGNVLGSGKAASDVAGWGPGDWIETDDSSFVIIEIPDIGIVKLEPGTKIKLIESSEHNNKFELKYGSVNSDTRSSKGNLYIFSDRTTAIDPGSVYKFAVDRNGEGLIYVKAGTVRLTSDNRSSVVPANQYCIIKTGYGPGTPYNSNASENLKKALIKFDFYHGGTEVLDQIYNYTDVKDYATLVNLIPFVNAKMKFSFITKASGGQKSVANIYLDSNKHFTLDEINKLIIEIQDEVLNSLEKNTDMIVNELSINIPDISENEYEIERFKKEMQEMRIELNEMNLEVSKFAEKIKQETFNTLKEDFNYNFNGKELMFFDTANFEFNFEEFEDELNKELKILESDLPELHKLDSSGNEMKKVIEELKETEKELESEINNSTGIEYDIIKKTQDMIKKTREKLENTEEKHDNDQMK